MINLLCLCTDGSEVSIYNTLMSWCSHVDRVYIQINNSNNKETIVREIMRTKMDVVLSYEKFKGFSENRNMLLELVDFGYIIFIDDSYELASCDSLNLYEKFYSVKITSLNKSVCYSRTIVQKIDQCGKRMYYEGEYHELINISNTSLASFEIIDIDYTQHKERRTTRFLENKKFKDPYNNICKMISNKDPETTKYIVENIHKFSLGKRFICYLFLTELDIKNALTYLKYASFLMRPNECYYRSYLISKNEEYLKMIRDVEIPNDGLPYDIKMYKDMVKYS